MTKQIIYIDPEPENYGTYIDDMEITEYNTFGYNSNGQIISSVSYNDSGPDLVWDTTDDNFINSYLSWEYNGSRIYQDENSAINFMLFGAFEYDDNLNLVKEIKYSSAGADLNWITAEDNDIEMYTVYEFEKK